MRMRMAQWRIFFVGLGLILTVVAVTAVLLSSLRHNLLEHRLTSLSNLALILSKQTDEAFHGISLVQHDMLAAVDAADVTDRSSFIERMSTPSIHQWLLERISNLPSLEAINLIDDTGQIISSSRAWPPAPVNVADRGYFQALRNAPEAAIFITRPLIGRVTGQPSLFLAQRISAPDGRFLGLVLAVLDKSFFEDNFAQIDLGPGGLIALVRDDGVILLSSASIALQSAAEVQATKSAIDTLSGSIATRRLPAGALDTAERFAILSRVSHFPLTIMVTETAQMVDKRVWDVIMPALLSALLLCVLIGVVGFFVARQFRIARNFARLEHYQARHDILTGLPNRLSFAEHLNALLTRPDAPASALLYLDLNYFRSVNDTLGHDVGDGVLQLVAKRLRGAITEGDMLARLGGDEFAIVRENMASDAEAVALARALITALRPPFIVGPHRIQLTGSVGIALFPRDGTEAATLLKNADLALNQAKATGHGTAQVYVAALSEALQEKTRLQMELQEAWPLRQFRLWYQPIFDARTRKLAGFEALLRWPHPVRGMIPPDRFIRLAEDTGLIVPIGAWTLEQACVQAAHWPDHLFMSVNLSPLQLRDDTALAQVRAALQSSRLPSHRLEVEITESVLLEIGPSVRHTLAQFQALGICVALDDFGTGYSSLSYLESLKINRIKVDRSFVANIHDPRGRAVVHAVLQLALALELQSTAEGVETEAQAQALESEGCTHLQGFLLGRPLPAEEADRLVRESMA